MHVCTFKDFLLFYSIYKRRKFEVNIELYVLLSAFDTFLD